MFQQHLQINVQQFPFSPLEGAAAPESHLALPCRRSVLLQPQRLHPHRLHVPLQRAEEGGDHGAPQPAGLLLLVFLVPGGPAVSPVRAALPLHTGPHGDGRPVREAALAGQPEERQLGGAGRHTGGRPAQVQLQVCIRVFLLLRVHVKHLMIPSWTVCPTKVCTIDSI